MRGATVTGGARPARVLALPDATANAYPAASNVRSGTVYGVGNAYTGTCAVPGAASVVVGVPVDNTTGTAAITAATIRSAVGLASANLDAQFSAIPAAPSAATVAAAVWQTLTSALTTAGSIGKLLADNVNATISSAAADSSGVTTLLSRLTSGRASALDNLDAAVSSRLASSSYSAAPSAASIRAEIDANSTKLDATVSSRLASSSYTAPPSVGDIATAVWAAATRTLTTAIDNSSTIAAAVWSYATGRTITGGTVDTLTNAPSVPSAAAIATATRQEMDANSTKLAHLDADVSSRLAPSGTLARVTLTDTATTLTNAPSVPSPQTVAAAVRIELTPELSRVANAATTQEVADIVEGAVDA